MHQTVKNKQLLNLVLNNSHLARYKTAIVNHSWENYCSRITMYGLANKKI
jgi:hypothetical protein